MYGLCILAEVERNDFEMEESGVQEVARNVRARQQ